MRNSDGEEHLVRLKESITFNDAEPIVRALTAGLGVALLPVPDVLAQLERGELIRLLPAWYADAGSISLYYPNKELQPRKISAFTEYLIDHFRREGLAERFAANKG
jgi:DNA-binding transcriptional LysR family regulator